MSNLWTYREGTMGNGNDVVGYDVEAIDGTIGKIDSGTIEADAPMSLLIQAGGSSGRSV